MRISPSRIAEQVIALLVYGTVVSIVVYFIVRCAPAGAAGFVPGRDFVIPSVDLRRNGLSDEQYAKIAQMRRNAGRPLVMNPSDAVDMIYHAERGRNIEGWLADVGRTNDFARLLVPTMETNLVLAATNAALSADNRRLARDLESAHGTVTNLEREVQMKSEEAFLWRARYEGAKPDADLAVRVKAALLDEGTLGPYLRRELVALRDAASDPKKREVFDACIALIDSAVNTPSEDTSK